MYQRHKLVSLIDIIRIWVSAVDTLWTVLMTTVSEVQYPVLIKWILYCIGQETLQQKSPYEFNRMSGKAFLSYLPVFNDLILTWICHAVKTPFLRYQLAKGVIQHSEESKIKPYPYAEHLLSPEGLGVPDRIFSNLEVTVFYFLTESLVSCSRTVHTLTHWLSDSRAFYWLHSFVFSLARMQWKFGNMTPMHVYPIVKLKIRWRDFHEILYWEVSLTTVDIFQFWLKSKKNREHYAWRPTCNLSVTLTNNFNRTYSESKRTHQVLLYQNWIVWLVIRDLKTILIITTRCYTASPWSETIRYGFARLDGSNVLLFRLDTCSQRQQNSVKVQLKTNLIRTILPFIQWWNTSRR
jgi:hypothetical protein